MSKYKSRPLVMGSETEYALSGRVSGRPVAPEELLGLVLQAACRYRHLPSAEASGGTFFQFGGRLYGEINGHPEYGTPECASAAQVALYDRVGERLLAETIEHVRAQSDGTIELTLTKSNLCPLHPDAVTHGNHESYTCWVPLSKAADALIPHLVTRLPYAGSGCLSGAKPAMGFELSQRAHHLTHVTSDSTTSHRGIFCTRVRYRRDQSSAGWIRAHLIGKDSQRAPLGTYLTFGTTGALFWVLNHGGAVGRGLALRDPVEALRIVSQHPNLDVALSLADGRTMTPIEIQAAYLNQCRDFAASHDPPEWVSPVLACWQQTLETLANNPLDLAGKLDAYTKLWVYQHELDRAGASWTDVRQGLQLLKSIRANFPPLVVQALLANDPHLLPPAQRAAYYAAKQSYCHAGAGPRSLVPRHSSAGARLRVSAAGGPI